MLTHSFRKSKQRIQKHLRRNTRKKEAGFTLIEILVVVIIIGLLSAYVAPKFFQRVGQSKQTMARAQIEALSAALNSYRLDNDYYPTTEQNLDALWVQPEDAPNWIGPYMDKELPNDPWGNAYVYLSPGEHNPQSFDLISYGRDGEPGGEGEDKDIYSWSID
jgi:general secretion pathway protein G